MVEKPTKKILDMSLTKEEEEEKAYQDQLQKIRSKLYLSVSNTDSEPGDSTRTSFTSQPEEEQKVSSSNKKKRNKKKNK